jgi:ribonuclease P protein component
LGIQISDSRFDKSRRLLNAQDYSRVFDKPDARASHKNLLLLGRLNERHQHRLGLVIAKKNVRKAVQRNRLKRVAREFFRVQPCTGHTLDVVLLARRGMDQLDNAELSSILQHQWQKLVQLSTRCANTPTNVEQEP